MEKLIKNKENVDSLLEAMSEFIDMSCSLNK
jgi:hypothetical protein